MSVQANVRMPQLFSYLCAVPVGPAYPHCLSNSGWSTCGGQLDAAPSLRTVTQSLAQKAVFISRPRAVYTSGPTAVAGTSR